MTLILNILTLFCWLLSVYYLLVFAVVVWATSHKIEASINPPLTWTGPLAICFLIAKYLM